MILIRTLLSRTRSLDLLAKGLHLQGSSFHVAHPHPQHHNQRRHKLSQLNSMDKVEQHGQADRQMCLYSAVCCTALVPPCFVPEHVHSILHRLKCWDRRYKEFKSFVEHRCLHCCTLPLLQRLKPANVLWMCKLLSGNASDWQVCTGGAYYTARQSLIRALYLPIGSGRPLFQLAALGLGI